jgi:hypothetical protein
MKTRGLKVAFSSAKSPSQFFLRLVTRTGDQGVTDPQRHVIPSPKPRMATYTPCRFSYIFTPLLTRYALILYRSVGLCEIGGSHVDFPS